VIRCAEACWQKAPEALLELVAVEPAGSSGHFRPVVPERSHITLSTGSRLAVGCPIIDRPALIIQLPRDGAVDRQLSTQPPASVVGGEVVVEVGPTDAEGNLEPADAGEVVLSVASPEALARDAGEVQRVIAHAGTGIQPLIVEVEAAEELRDDELAPVLEAAAHASRTVILRVIRDA
jgi:hypothetical protein